MSETIYLIIDIKSHSINVNKSIIIYKTLNRLQCELYFLSLTNIISANLISFLLLYCADFKSPLCLRNAINFIYIFSFFLYLISVSKTLISHIHELSSASFAMLAIGIIIVNQYLYESQNTTFYIVLPFYDTLMHVMRYFCQLLNI
jgi:hypothetical protein